MFHVAASRAANFITTQEETSLATPKKTYNLMQLNLIHRPQQSLQYPLTPGYLSTKNLKF